MKKVVGMRRLEAKKRERVLFLVRFVVLGWFLQRDAGEIGWAEFGGLLG